MCHQLCLRKKSTPALRRWWTCSTMNRDWRTQTTTYVIPSRITYRSHLNTQQHEQVCPRIYLTWGDRDKRARASEHRPSAFECSTACHSRAFRQRWLFSIMNEWMSECKNEWMNEWMNEWISEWMIDWLNEWMNEWVSEWANSKLGFFLPWRSMNALLTSDTFQLFQKLKFYVLPGHSLRLRPELGYVRVYDMVCAAEPLPYPVELSCGVFACMKQRLDKKGYVDNTI